MKYELNTSDIIKVDGKILTRIRAIADFSDVKSGDLGGYVQSFKDRKSTRLNSSHPQHSFPTRRSSDL